MTDIVERLRISIPSGSAYHDQTFREAADEIERLRAVRDDAVGALRFILAFYEPGQRYLDTEAWKNAEAAGRAVVARADRDD